MNLEPTHESGSADLPDLSRWVRRAIWAGWICVVLSALFLALSKVVSSDTGSAEHILWAIFLMVARMCGIASFAIGLVAIYNRRWTSGVLMLLCAVWLPVMAFIFFGTI